MRIPLSRVFELGASKSSGEVSPRHHGSRRTSFGRELEHALEQSVISDGDSSQAAPRPEPFLPAVAISLPKLEESLPRGKHDLVPPERVARDPFVRIVTKQLSARAAVPRVDPEALGEPLIESAQHSPENGGSTPRAGVQTGEPSGEMHTSAPREGAHSPASRDDVRAAVPRGGANSSASRDDVHAAVPRDVAHSNSSRNGAHAVAPREGVQSSAPRDDIHAAVPRGGAHSSAAPVEVRTASSRTEAFDPAPRAPADAPAPRTITRHELRHQGDLELPHATTQEFADATSMAHETRPGSAPAKESSTAPIVAPGAAPLAHTEIAQSAEHTMQPSTITSHSPLHQTARQEISYRPDASVRPDLTRPDLTRPDLTRLDLTRPDLTRLDLTRPDLARPDLAQPEPSPETANNTPPIRVVSPAAANATSDTMINKVFDAVRHVVTEGAAQCKSIDPLRGSELLESTPPIPATVRSLASTPTPSDMGQHHSMTQERSTHQNANPRALHPNMPPTRSTYVDAASSTARETNGRSSEDSATVKSASAATPTPSTTTPIPAASTTLSPAATVATPPALASRAEANLSNSEALIAHVVQRLAGAPTNGTVTLRLDPPELGTLIVRFERRGGQLNVTMSAERDDVTRLLKQDLGQLQSSLSQAREPVQVQVETLGSARERNADDLPGRRGEEQTFDSDSRHHQDLRHNDAARDQAANASRELSAQRSRRAARNARLDVWS